MMKKRISSPRERTSSPWEVGEQVGGTVTRIELQKHSGSERVNVYLDESYAFSLTADIGMPLRAGQWLEPTVIRELLAQDAADRAYQHALHFLAARPRSIAEVRRRLSERGHEAAAIDAAITRLAHHRLVDDQ